MFTVYLTLYKQLVISKVVIGVQYVQLDELLRPKRRVPFSHWSP